MLRDLEPKIGNLSIHPHIPRGDELTIQEEMNIIHGGATPAQYATAHELLLEQQRQDIIDNISPISPVSPNRFGQMFQNQAEQINNLEYDDFPELNEKYGIPTQTSQNGAEQTNSLEYDDFPELNAKYGLPPITKTPHNPTPTTRSPSRHPATDLASTSTSTSTEPPTSQYQNRYHSNNNPLCTGPCPLKFPHNQGPYLQQGLVPRVWNPRWGYSDPPKRIWDAFVRSEQGRGSEWDEVEVGGFAVAHWWDGL